MQLGTSIGLMVFDPDNRSRLILLSTTPRKLMVMVASRARVDSENSTINQIKAINLVARWVFLRF